MSGSISISCAVWHEFLPLKIIEEKIALSADMSWSRGDVNPKTGLKRDRTSCLFKLGRFSQQEISEGMIFLYSFLQLSTIDGFFESGGRIVVYLTNHDDVSELYLNTAALGTIGSLSAEIVVRQAATI